MRREVPDPWATAMIERGLVYAKRPSIRALARAAGIPSSETVRQMIHGESDPDITTTNAVADALKVARGLVGEWVGQARTAAREWQVPDEVQLLTPAEMQAITELIKAIALPRKSNQRVSIAGSGKTASIIDLLSNADSPEEVAQMEQAVAARREQLQLSPEGEAQALAGEGSQE